MSSSKPQNMVIVVGRQFGSGGRKIGKMLAERFQLPYYDKEILSKSAERYGFSPDIFAKYDEKRPSALRALFAHSFGVPEVYTSSSMSGEKIYEAQGTVIRDLAEENGGVFVGRSADYILRDYPDLLSIFLHAPIEHRARAIVERCDATTVEQGIEQARKLDSNRENFYNYFTGRRWGHCDNYHLSLDASRLSAEQIVDVICAYIEGKK